MRINFDAAANAVDQIDRLPTLDKGAIMATVFGLGALVLVAFSNESEQKIDTEVQPSPLVDCPSAGTARPN